MKIITKELQKKNNKIKNEKNPKMRNQMIILLSIENKNQIIMDENCMT